MQPKPHYEAVTRDQLVARLGAQCSPMRDREGYVIGPAVDGRICHVATCFTMREAREMADASNAYHAARANRTEEA